MSLGKRCDEIVRLIDETLADVAVEPEGMPSDDTGPAMATATARPVGPVRAERRWRWVPPDPGPADREAAGF